MHSLLHRLFSCIGHWARQLSCLFRDTVELLQLWCFGLCIVTWITRVGEQGGQAAIGSGGVLVGGGVLVSGYLSEA